MSPVEVQALTALVESLCWLAVVGGVVGAVAYSLVRDALAWWVEHGPTPVSDRLMERARKHREYLAAGQVVRQGGRGE